MGSRSGPDLGDDAVPDPEPAVLHHARAGVNPRVRQDQGLEPAHLPYPSLRPLMNCLEKMEQQDEGHRPQCERGEEGGPSRCRTGP